MTSGRNAFARTLRQQSGSAEQRVWTFIRAGKVNGHKFRRQHPIGRYITDFACERLRLVLEIDGGIHQRDDVALNDHLRQAELEAMGWTVLRFSNQKVFSNIEALADVIRAHARLIDI